MDSQQYTLSTLRQDLIDNNLHVKAIIQDILAFRGTLAELEEYNEAGRAKLSALRKCIERMNEWASDEADAALYREVDAHRQQFSRTLQAFRKANIATLLAIEKEMKRELFSSDDADQSAGEGENNSGVGGGGDESSGTRKVRHRHTAAASATRHTRSSLVSQQNSVTDRMLSISRTLSETTQRSAATLDTLVASSVNVEGTRDELHATAGTITQSGKLLQKYGRRECTDKVLLMFAFAFFLACVLYIVQKRLF